MSTVIEKKIIKKNNKTSLWIGVCVRERFTGLFVLCFKGFIDDIRLCQCYVSDTGYVVEEKLDTV